MFNTRSSLNIKISSNGFTYYLYHMENTFCVFVNVKITNLWIQILDQFVSYCNLSWPAFVVPTDVWFWRMLDIKCVEGDGEELHSPAFTPIQIISKAPWPYSHHPPQHRESRAPAHSVAKLAQCDDVAVAASLPSMYVSCSGQWHPSGRVRRQEVGRVVQSQIRRRVGDFHWRRRSAHCHLPILHMGG